MTVFSLKPIVGQDNAMHVSPTVRNFFLVCVHAVFSELRDETEREYVHCVVSHTEHKTCYRCVYEYAVSIWSGQSL